MTPPTVHLICQLIRFQRGALTSIERWATTQAPHPMIGELCGVTSLMRDVLRSYEDRISRLEDPELRERGLVDHLPELTGQSVRERP